MKHKLKGIAESREVYLDGTFLSPKRSQKAYNHSPDGFNWGYGGSGPAQLALAVLLELTTKDDALARYQEFKRSTIAGIPQNKDFEIEFEVVDIAMLNDFAEHTYGRPYCKLNISEKEVVGNQAQLQLNAQKQ